MLLSRREKLLLGLLTSTLIFSASFSYGAVDQSRVSSIMSTITTKASLFSDVIPPSKSQSPRAEYYTQVYTGLRDAIDMLIVVRDQVASLAGVDTKSISPGNPGGNPTDSPPVGISYPPSSGDITTAMRNCPKGSYFVGELIKTSFDETYGSFFSWNKSYPPSSTGSYAVFTMSIPELDYSTVPIGTYGVKEIPLLLAANITPNYVTKYVDAGNIISTGNYEYVISEKSPCDFSGERKFTFKGMFDNAGGLSSWLKFYKKGDRLTFFGKEVSQANYLPDNTKYYFTIRAKADDAGKASVNIMVKPSNYVGLPTNEDRITGLRKLPEGSVYYNNLGGAYGVPAFLAFANPETVPCYAKNTPLSLKQSLGCSNR